MDVLGDPSGPLTGVRVLEMAGMGPAPFAAMMLADMGAEVVRVDRPPSASAAVSPVAPDPLSVQLRGRRSICIDVKQADGLDVLLDLVSTTDVLIEGFRPGVAERLGFGPSVCAARNPALIYARATGWGQGGPLAHTSGHDITYLAVSGALYPVGPADGPPTPPMNFLADYGGGGLFLAFGIATALVERSWSGEGQCIDAAMVDGVSLFTTRIHAQRALGTWHEERGRNTLDGGAHFYSVYETSDGQYVAVGAIEPPFYAAFMKGLGLTDPQLPAQMDGSSWPAMRRLVADRFRQRSRSEWCDVFAGVDACVAPVLSPAEATTYRHNRERGTFVEAWGVVQPAPGPRLSRTPGKLGRPPATPGQHTEEILAGLGASPDRVEALQRAGVVA